MQDAVPIASPTLALVYLLQSGIYCANSFHSIDTCWQDIHSCARRNIRGRIYGRSFLFERLDVLAFPCWILQPVDQIETGTIGQVVDWCCEFLVQLLDDGEIVSDRCVFIQPSDVNAFEVEGLVCIYEAGRRVEGECSMALGCREVDVSSLGDVDRIFRNWRIR